MHVGSLTSATTISDHPFVSGARARRTCVQPILAWQKMASSSSSGRAQVNRALLASTRGFKNASVAACHALQQSGVAVDQPGQQAAPSTGGFCVTTAVNHCRIVWVHAATSLLRKRHRPLCITYTDRNANGSASVDTGAAMAAHRVGKVWGDAPVLARRPVGPLVCEHGRRLALCAWGLIAYVSCTVKSNRFSNLLHRAQGT